MHHIVVWDPENLYWEGAIVDAVRMNELRSRGVVTLPCVPDLFRHAGSSGYSKRSWGAGWPLDTITPQLVCPLTMFVTLDAPRQVEWCARLVPSTEAMARIERGAAATQGILRLAASEARGTQLRPALTDNEGKNAIELAKLGAPDRDGGWSVYGRTQIHANMEGAYGLALYGFAPGIRVAWLAASLSS